MVNFSDQEQRRRKLLAKVDKNAVIILTSAPEYCRNGDVHYTYYQNSDFYYLTAFPEPNAMLLLLPAQEKSILFNRSYDPLKAIWNGQVIGQKRACQEYGMDEAYPIDQLEDVLPNYLEGHRYYYWIGDQQNGTQRRRFDDILKRNKLPISEGSTLIPILHEMRLIKSPTELNCLRKAATISSEAHMRAMKACRPGLYEYQLEAELLYEFYQNGSRVTAYPNIVASGGNACILHYTDNNAVLKSGDLVLIDAGCEYQSYASDITRCFPVNGRFSAEQKAIYHVVLKAQQALIDLVKPGIAWDSLQTSCIQTITEGLVDLGLLKGNVSSLIEQKAYKNFYMHGCSHWLGLDVHDVGGYKQDEKWRHLEPNMVFTVEPGIYIPANTPHVDEKWWNIGIRIEDDISVTEKSCEILSQAAPKEIADIESLMRSYS